MTNPSELIGEIWWRCEKCWNIEQDIFEPCCIDIDKNIIPMLPIIVLDLAALRAHECSARKLSKNDVGLVVSSYYDAYADGIASLLPPNVPDEGEVE